jgi:hypothetical protein
MDQRWIEPSLFVELLRSKIREVRFTKHARFQSEKRLLPLKIAEQDIFEKTPLIVLEQDSERKEERKFNVYYPQDAGLFHRYVVAINSELRVITVIRTSKELQKKTMGE